MSLGGRDTFVGITINSERFSRGAAGLSMRPIENFKCADLWSLVEGLTQSNDDFEVDDSFLLDATYAAVPRGEGGVRKKKINVDVIKQRSIIFIQNDDRLCLPRALVVGEAYIQMKRTESAEARIFYRAIRDSRRPLQKRCALELMEKVGLTIPLNGAGYREMEQFQSQYARLGIAIVVYDKSTLGSGEPPFFDGRAQLARESVEGENFVTRGIINLLFDPEERHYDVILNLTGASGSRYFCERCNVAYNFVDLHTCSSVCPRCFGSPACSTTEVQKKCEDCLRYFFGDACFERHARIGRVACEVKNLFVI